MRSYIDAFIDFYSGEPFAFGTADICLADSPQSPERAAAFAAVMFQARTEANEPAIRRVVVLLPPGLATPMVCDTSIASQVIDAAEHLFGRSLTQQELAMVSNRLIVAQARDLTIESALTALGAAVSSNDAAIVLYGAEYRAAQELHPSLVSVTPTLQEDLWVPHLVHFACLVTERAKKANCYVLLDAGEAPPRKGQNLEALRSVVGCGLFSMAPEHDAAEHLAAHWDEWLREIREGHVGSVFASIDALPEWMDSQKSFIKLQLFDRVAPGLEVLKMLRAEVESRTQIDASARVRMAQIAQRADGDDLATTLLKPAISTLTRREELELALEIATRIGDTDLIEGIAHRLGSLFPRPSTLFKHRVTNLMDERRYSEVISLLDVEEPPIDSELQSFYRTLAAEFRSDGTPAYDSIIREISRTAPAHENWARAVCSREALARRDFGRSISLCLPSDGMPLTAGTARMLLHATRRALLERTSAGELVLSGDDLFGPVSELIEYLARNPTDGRLRQGLSRLLSVETAGSLGLAVVTSVALNTARAGVNLVTHSRSGKQRESTDIDLGSFLRSIFEWMERESPVIMNVTKLPASLLPAPPDDVLGNLKQLLEFDQDLRDSPTAQAFELVLFAAILVAPLTSTPNEDLDVLRYAAARLIAANRIQGGRDLAEQALASAGDAAERRRLAWLAFADIYHRAHNAIDSLIGIACMYAVEVGVDVAQLWQETYSFIRVLRDLHFFDASRSVLTRLRSLSSLTESPAVYERRLATLDLGIQLNQVSQSGQYDMDQLATLTGQIERHCVELRAAGEEVSPALSLLVHCIHLAQLRGYSVSERALSTAQTLLQNAPAALRDLITTVVRPDSEGQRLLALGKSLQAARSHEDIGFDLAHIGIAARRLLDTEAGMRNADAVMLAIEALADHAVRGSSIGSEGSAFTSLGTTRERAASISATGCRVTFLGLSETGRMVRVDVANGGLEGVVVETRDVFSAAALEDWSERFPYAYARTDDPNAFWTSTDKLGLTLVPSGPVVLVMDTSVQRFPPNLIRLGQEFAGRIVPVGVTPSISWLSEVRKLPTVDRERKAWISTDTTAGGDPALSWLAERVQDCFAHHNFAVDNGPTLPDNLRNSELVVIAAHGGLLPEGRFIQRVAANVDSAMYPATLASAIGDSSVVVLFICSGGRIDPHPQAKTTVGLVKELLDEGCSAVVASPWPLDVKVPPRWLPTFLERWSEGDTVMKAVFQANAEVAQWFGGAPVDCLAMNVYGDPLRRRSR